MRTAPSFDPFRPAGSCDANSDRHDSKPSIEIHAYSFSIDKIT
jgi:hypothetical protein